ncbi:60S ribosomal protein L35 [Hibiscus syriacus]|uniref:Pectate lyase n=1 Tax=Hibiscus syriacus TaxID=106335 RepID=A0A6A3BMW7_HIBSY|nr:60S ribosomal protein L35 [Hibiscus syriacus]
MTSLTYADVDGTLRAIDGHAEGFGQFAIGCLHGHLFPVTSLSDDGPGSLREACRSPGPGWIVFDVSGTIQLSSYLHVGSHKTIDGRGERVTLIGKGLRLKECENVIICNMEFEGGRGHDVDGIQIKPNSKHIWIDRCSFKDYDDGLIDITRGSTDVTVSRLVIIMLLKFGHGVLDNSNGSKCRGSIHRAMFELLTGADPNHVGDRSIRVTIHHCFFDGIRQRQPRVRFGKVHLYNNYTRNWQVYAVCASVEAQIYSQCNIYEAEKKKKTFEFYTEKAADREEACSGTIRLEGDMFLNEAQTRILAGISESMFHPSEYYKTWTMEAPSDSLKHVLQVCTGWQPVPRPVDRLYVILFF